MSTTLREMAIDAAKEKGRAAARRHERSQENFHFFLRGVFGGLCRYAPSNLPTEEIS